MKTRSCKAKGREFQNKIRDMYRTVAGSRLQPGDIEGRQMGGTGVDIVFSPAAQEVFKHLVECKKHRRVVVPTLFAAHYEKYKDDLGLKLLYHENDRSESLVTMRAKDFMQLLEKMISQEAKIYQLTLDVGREDRLMGV